MDKETTGSSRPLTLHRQKLYQFIYNSNYSSIGFEGLLQKTSDAMFSCKDTDYPFNDSPSNDRSRNL